MPVSAKLTSDQDPSKQASAAARNTAKSEQVVDDDFHNMEPGRRSRANASRELLQHHLEILKYC